MNSTKKWTSYLLHFFVSPSDTSQATVQNIVAYGSERGRAGQSDIQRVRIVSCKTSNCSNTFIHPASPFNVRDMCMSSVSASSQPILLIYIPPFPTAHTPTRSIDNIMQLAFAFYSARQPFERHSVHGNRFELNG